MCVISTILTLSTTLATTLGLSLLGGTAATVATGAAATAATTTAVTGAVAGTVAGSAGAAVGASAVAGAAAATTATASSLTAASVLGFAAMATTEIVVAGGVAGGVVGTVSGVQNAEMQKAQAEYMADIEAENSRLAARNAEAIKLQGNQEKLATYNKMMQTKGTGRDIADAYDLDMRNLDYDIASRSWQSKVQAISASNQAALYRTQAKAYGQQKTTSLLSGTLGTLSKVGNSASGVVKLFN